MRQFLTAIDMPQLAYSERLSELREWFSGNALTQIGSFLRSRDVETAFSQAIARLKEVFGRKSTTADDMLAGIMKGDPLVKGDFIGIDKFVCGVEEIFSLALETNRDVDFNRRAVIHRILKEKLPFYIAPWAKKVSKSKEEKTFVEFLAFLIESRSAASEIFDIDDSGYTVVTRKSIKPMRVSSTVVEEESDEDSPPTYAQVAASPAKKADSKPAPVTDSTLAVTATLPVSRPATRTTPAARRNPFCVLCKTDGHYCEMCPRFTSLEIDEKAAYLKAVARCYHCTQNHATASCRVNKRCGVCQGKHATSCHGVKAHADRLEATAAPAIAAPGGAAASSARPDA